MLRVFLACTELPHQPNPRGALSQLADDTLGALRVILAGETGDHSVMKYAVVAACGVVNAGAFGLLLADAPRPFIQRLSEDSGANREQQAEGGPAPEPPFARLVNSLASKALSAVSNGPMLARAALCQLLASVLTVGTSRASVNFTSSTVAHILDAASQLAGTTAFGGAKPSTSKALHPLDHSAHSLCVAALQCVAVVVRSVSVPQRQASFPADMLASKGGPRPSPTARSRM
jgi:hypothetical protein